MPMPLPDSIRSQANVVYAIDRSYALIAINSGYRESYVGTDPAGFLICWGVGSSALDAIDSHLQPFYRALYERAFAGEIVEHRYQCHLPDRYREFRMRLLPDVRRETALVEHALIIDRHLPSFTDLDDAAIRAHYLCNGVVVQCCHCRKARRSGAVEAWDWVSRLIEQPWPAISHGLCPVCLEYYYPADRPADDTPS